MYLRYPESITETLQFGTKLVESLSLYGQKDTSSRMAEFEIMPV